MIATSRAAMLRAAMSTASGSGGEICCSVGAASVPLAGCLISGVRRRNRNVAALRARIRRRFSQSGGESGRSLRLVREVSSPQLYDSSVGYRRAAVYGTCEKGELGQEKCEKGEYDTIILREKGFLSGN